MKTLRVVFVSLTIIGLGAAAVLGIRAVTNRSAAVSEASKLVGAPIGPATPADRQVRAALGAIQGMPDQPAGYNLLAAAYMQKARESGDFSLNSKAEEALARSSALSVDNFDSLKLRAKLLLTFHRFTDALQVARQAQAINPRDHDVFGALTDALVELGDYPAAIASAQTMMDLRPDTASYSRVSYLRQLHGDIPGAIEAMRLAAQSANPNDLENVAWCLVQLGDGLLATGKLTEAEHEYDRALFSFADYPPAIAAKARARVVAGDTDKAIQLYKRAIERVPSPDYAIALGDVYTVLGRTEEARMQYDLVQFIERTSAASGTYSRQLALFWADHKMRLDEALAVARREAETRKDIYTFDLLAWCLFKNGQSEEAKMVMDQALHLGTRDARLFYHAGMIANSLGDHRAAVKYLRQAVVADASIDALQSEVARRTLAGLKPPSS